MKIKNLLLLLLFVAFVLPVAAQNKIGDNPRVIHAGSLLELESLTKGLRLPRIPLNNVAQWTLEGSPTSGMMIFNENGSAPKGLYYWSMELPQQWIQVVSKSDLSTLIANYLTQNTAVRDSIIKLINTTITSGTLNGQDVTSNSKVLKVVNGSGAAIKAVQVDLDINELGHSLNTSPLTDSLSVAISNSTVIRESIISIMNNASFNTDRKITLAGTSATGQNLGAGGKTMDEFFEAFFFPALSATPPVSTLTTTTTTFPYSTWKNWGNPPSGNVAFAWTVINKSLTDNSDDKVITSIKLKSGATELATVTPVNGGDQSGTFTAIPFANALPDAKTIFSKTYTLEVIDKQPQTVSKDITLTMSAAIPLTYPAPTLTPNASVYEYDVNNKAITLSWAITPNDEAITNISVDGAPAGSTSLTGTKALAFKCIANGGVPTKVYPLMVVGSIYGAGTIQNSPAVSWANRLFRGAITSAVLPRDGSFSFTDTQVKTTLTSETKLGGNWKAAAGYDFDCGAGGQYVVFAYPDDLLTPVVEYYDATFKAWMAYDSSDITIINRTNFSNQYGYTGTNYKLVFVNVQYFNQTVKLRIQ